MGNVVISNQGGAESGAVGARDGVLSVPDDPRLLAVIDAWAMLTKEVREAVVKMAGIRPDDLNDVDDMAPAMPCGEGVSS